MAEELAESLDTAPSVRFRPRSEGAQYDHQIPTIERGRFELTCPGSFDP
jgi:hypothetical protein